MAPHLKFPVIALTATLLLIIALKSPGQELSETPKVYVATGQEATLSGSITFSGKAPKAQRIDTSADPVCNANYPGLMTEFFVVNDEKLANVLVYVTSDSVLKNYSFAPPTTLAALEHKGCRYEPHVMGIRAGQTLQVWNRDSTQHNTHPSPKSNPEWNQSQPEGVEPLVHSFDRAELLIPFKDNQHPWEKAYVSVFKHPFFAVSDEYGRFNIEGLPPGSYKLTAWHEKLGEKTVDLMVVPGESRHLSFTFTSDDLKPISSNRR